MTSLPNLPPTIDFYNAPDGRKLAVRIWHTVEPPAGRVVFLHGITSHGGWYNRSCEHLAAAGFEVHFLDRRGSGLNREQSGDVDSWQTWIDDVAVYLQKYIRHTAGNSNTLSVPAPCSLLPAPVLCGISWGGKLAVAVARQHIHLLGGLALICPGLYSHQEPNLLKRIALGLPQPARLARRQVPIPLKEPALFIDDRSRQRFVATDPLSLREITLRFAREDRALCRFARESACHIHLPLLLVLAGRDRIVDNRRTRSFFGAAPGPRKTIIEYPNATHTLEFERDPSDYFRDLTNWLRSLGPPRTQSDSANA